MDCSSYLHNYTPIAEQLQKYGFTAVDGGWLLQRDLPFKNLFVTIRIVPPQFEVRVIDKTFNDDFLPFAVKGGNSPVKAAVNKILDEILATCFANTKRDVIAHCEQTYHTPHAKPWPEFPEYCTFKTVNSQKWYAIIMNIPCNKLGLTGDAMVDIINVKLPPEQIPGLIDGQHYFAAYHMNKKYWLTVLLDQATDMAQLKNLIDTSYQLVEK